MAAAAGRRTSVQHLLSEADHPAPLPGLVEDLEERPVSPALDPRIQKILAKIEAGNEAIRELQAENNNLSLQVEDLTHQIETKNAEIERLSKELQSAGEKSEKATFELERVKTELTAAKQANQVLVLKGSTGHDYLVASENTAQRHAEQIATIKMTQAKNLERIRQLERTAEYSSEEYAHLTKANASQKKHLVKLTADMKVLNTEKIALESSDEKLQKIIHELQETNKALTAENERLQRELKKCRFGTCCSIQ